MLALRSRPAGGGFKPPTAALAEDCRGERCGKRPGSRVRPGSGRRALQPLTCRNRLAGIKTGAGGQSRDEPGGCPFTGQVVPGMEAT